MNFNYIKALKFLGESYFEIEDFVRAKFQLEECKNVASKMDKELILDDSVIIRAQQILGKCYYELSDYTLAKEELEEALESTSLLDIQASIKLDLSKSLLEFNFFNDALKMAEEAYTFYKKDDKCKSCTFSKL